MDSRSSFILAAVLFVAMINVSLAKITCVTCRGSVDSVCHRNPEKVPQTLQCDKCAVFGKVYDNGGLLQEVVRDCAFRIFPSPIPWIHENTCKDDNSHFIECTHTCTSGNLCSNSLSYAPPGWKEDGSRNNGVQSTTSMLLMLPALLTLISSVIG